MKHCTSCWGHLVSGEVGGCCAALLNCRNESPPHPEHLELQVRSRLGQGSGAWQDSWGSRISYISRVSNPLTGFSSSRIWNELWTDNSSVEEWRVLALALVIAGWLSNMVEWLISSSYPPNSNTWGGNSLLLFSSSLRGMSEWNRMHSSPESRRRESLACLVPVIVSPESRILTFEFWDIVGWLVDC